VRQNHPALTAGKRAGLVLPFGSHESSPFAPRLAYRHPSPACRIRLT
jgi:hypothetical protein